MCKLCINSPQCWWCTNTNVKWQDTHFANCATPLVRPISSYPRFKVQTRHNTHLCRLHEKKKREITGHQNPFQSFQFHLFPQSDQPQHSWFSSIADDFGLSNSSWPCKRLAWQSQQIGCQVLLCVCLNLRGDTETQESQTFFRHLKFTSMNEPSKTMLQIQWFHIACTVENSSKRSVWLMRPKRFRSVPWHEPGGGINVSDGKLSKCQLFAVKDHLDKIHLLFNLWLCQWMRVDRNAAGRS